ncbi:MAG: LacI family transcriptional regulator [Lachnospiraceae bacterium]|nr:LacI family transcriptional regulator [Lachnospiraceae bacterium]
MTINDIARLAGTSKSTVSRVLTDNPNVNEKTRQRVLDVIQKYQYRPNSIARGLVKGGMQIIAVIVPNFRNPFYSEVIWFIERELFKLGYHMFLYCSNNDTEKERACLEMTFQYNFAGVIIISPIMQAYLQEHADSLGCPVLLLNRYIDQFSGDILTVDNFQAAYVATRHLIELGHQKIAILAADPEAYTHKDRRSGFLHALSSYQLTLPESFDCVGDLTMDGGYHVGEQLLSMKKNGPTAVFCTSDMMALGLIQAYRNADKKIPEDLSIVGFDDISIASLNGISLTTMQQPYEQIGIQAARMILKRIQNQKLPQQKVILDCKLIVRNSTAAPEPAHEM